MKALVIGAGSIGRRHLRNLRGDGRAAALLVTDADPARADAASAETGARAVPSLAAALAEAPEVALVCTPTHLHLEQALACVRAGCHVFVEKPLAASQQGVAELGAEAAARGRHVMVGYNLRFDDVYRRVRRLLDEGALGRVRTAHLHFGYDLRRWRPGVDYLAVYSAWRAQGGGVVLDAIHEIDLALWLFGAPRRVLSLSRRTGALAGDAEDAADLAIEFRSGMVATLHVDYLDPVYRRTISVAGDAALVEGDFATGTVRLRRADGTEETFRREEPDGVHDAMYVRELAHFLDAVEGRARPTAPLSDGVSALEVALAARDGGPVTGFSRPRPSYEKITAVVQARLGSTRLPGKVLLPAAGRPMLEHQIARLRRAKRVERVVLATSEAPADRALVAEAARLGIDCFTGSEHDVLGRYLGAVRRFDLPAVVRITADCPLLDPAAVDAVIARFLDEAPDYASNIHPRSVPDGLDVEVVSREALERADRECDDPAIREHVTLYIVRHPERFQQVAVAPLDRALACRRWTLDTRADYEFLKAVFEALYPEKPEFSLDDVLALLERRPELDTVPRYAL